MTTSVFSLTNAARDVILLSPLATIIPGSTFITEANCVSFTMNFTMTGGSFTASLLYGSVTPLPLEDTAITMPFGRIGVVKQVGSSWSSGGIVDVISGPILPVPATLQTFYAIPSGTSGVPLITVANTVLNASSPGSASIGGSRSGISLIWLTASPRLLNFSYRGTTLQGVQQCANILLADLVFRKEGVYVVDPGTVVPSSAGGTGFGGGITGTAQYTPFTVNSADIVSVQQTVDYSLDVASVLNPTLQTPVNTSLPGTYVYDEQHAQKQPKFTVRAGAPQGSGATDFIEIPDGWLVDGSFEEWFPDPTSGNLANPSPGVTNGRYWKVYPSPSTSGAMRGIMSFSRLIKELRMAGSVSSFVASPVTGYTQQGPNTFQLQNWTSNGGFYGFDSTGGVGGTTVQDIISDQYLTLPNSIVLAPASGGDSGEAYNNFYHIDMELWTFPLVNPTTMPLGPSINPFGIPPGTAVVTPSQNVINGWGTGYYAYYLKNYQLVNSPRLRTTVSVVYRNYIPQVGDQLIINSPPGFTPASAGVRYNDCGRISNISLTFGRGGVVLAITAEKYQFVPGKWNSATSGGAPGGARIG